MTRCSLLRAEIIISNSPSNRQVRHKAETKLQFGSFLIFVQNVSSFPPSAASIGVKVDFQKQRSTGSVKRKTQMSSTDTEINVYLYLFFSCSLTFGVNGEEEEKQAGDQVPQESDDSTGDAFRDRVNRLDEELEEYRHAAVYKDANQDAGSVQDGCESAKQTGQNKLQPNRELSFIFFYEGIKSRPGNPLKKRMAHWSSLWSSRSDLFHLPRLSTPPFVLASGDL